MQSEFDNRKVEVAMNATPELSVAVRSGLIQTALLCHSGDALHSGTTAQEDTLHTDVSPTGVIASCDASTDPLPQTDSAPALLAVAGRDTLPLYRRLGRRVLRLLHPITLPFIRRIRDLAQEGVDASATTRRLMELITAQQSQLRQVVEQGVDASATTRRLVELITAQQSQLRQVAEQSEAALAKMRAEASMRLVAQQSQLRQVAEQSEAALAKMMAEASMRLVAQHDQLRQVADQSERISDKMNSSISGIAKIGEKTTDLASAAVSNTTKLLQSRAVSIGAEVLTRTPFGWLLVPSEDMRLVAALVETGGSLEPGTASVLQAILEPGDLAVDVGGHVGTLALAMARAVGPTGRILVLEPTPRNADLLRRTAIMTSLENVIQVEQIAAGATEGRSTLFFGVTSGHNSLFPIGETLDSIEVDVKPLDALLPADARPALVKIDAEGAELDIWQGMTRLITDTPELAVVVEFGPIHLARQGISIDDWIAALTEPGFTAWEIEEASGILQPLRSSGLDEIFSLNLLLLRAAPSRWPRLRMVDS